MVMRKAAVLTALAAGLMVSGQALAEETGSSEGNFYIGAGIGYGMTDESTSGDVGGTPVTITIDDEDVTFQGLIGYRLNDYLAVEAYAADLGSYAVNGTVAGIPVSAGDMDATSIGAGVVLSMPLGEDLRPFVRGGVQWWEADFDAAGVTADDTDWYAGLGLEFELTEQFWLRGEWTRYQLDEVEVDNLGVTVLFAF